MASKSNEAAVAGRHGYASVLDVTREGEGVENLSTKRKTWKRMHVSYGVNSIND
jgi:hypothetical protein